jgi:EAL domain-containing protein (putative c-di-GMP-specific phosphodiesterase class I)
LSMPELDARRLAERIRACLAEPFTVGGHELSVTASIGIAIRRVGEAPEALIDRADRAMYHAKSQGRNRSESYTEEIGAVVKRRSDLRHELGMALQRDQFTLEYQRITGPGGDCVAAEALLRWSHPVFGQIAPAEFVPLAEQTGLIVDIGTWVLRTALRQCRAWRQAGWIEAEVTVNLSTVELRSGIVDRVRSALADAQLPPDALILEITETALIEDGPEAMGSLDALRAMGVNLAIDDFGTGYASLAYLRTLPVSYLKIDRSFTRGIHAPAADRVIVQATIDLGHALGLTIIAEGVETSAELAVLRNMGCDQVQGYLLGRPVTPDKFSWAPSTHFSDSPVVSGASRQLTSPSFSGV